MALGVTLRQLGLWNVTQPQGRGGEGRVPGPAPLCSGRPAGSRPPAGSGPPMCIFSPSLPHPPCFLPTLSSGLLSVQTKCFPFCIFCASRTHIWNLAGRMSD